PYTTYLVLTANGVGSVVSIVAGGMWPVVEIGLSWWRRRHVDELSVVVLVFLAVGAAASLAVHSVRLALVKESIGTGLFGLVLLGSLLLRRPLMFYFGRRFATDGSAQGAARWDGYWHSYSA